MTFDTNAAIRVYFPNGYHISIVSGPGTYSDLRYKEPSYFAYLDEFPPEYWFNVEEVEIAIFKPDSSYVTRNPKDRSEVWGYVPTADVLRIVEHLSTTPETILDLMEMLEPEDE